MELNQILSESISQIALPDRRVATYVVPRIPRRILIHAWRTFCPHEDRTGIIALIDTSFLRSGKEGFLFTKSALYIREAMHHVRRFSYNQIKAVIYFQALSTYSGKQTVSMEIDTEKEDYEVNNVLLKNLNSSRLNQMLQQIVSLYHPDERREIETEIEDQRSQIAHPEKFHPHKFKDDDPQVYQK